MKRTCHCLHCITPPYLLQRLLESNDQDIRNAALNTLITTARLRGERDVRTTIGSASSNLGAGRRTIFDAKNSRSLPAAAVARTEDSQPSTDDSVNRAFDGFGFTRAFLKEILQRDSIDGKGMRLDGYVHFGVKFNNAFWNGQQMVFGDGDGVLFTDFTKSIDVIAHELAHGITEFTAGLEYANQPGALNESISDVFGTLVKQWVLKQKADAADWLIGADVLTPRIKADALRSMKAPGTAYDNDLLGRDPQPAHMKDYVELPNTDEGDNGGVHVNSGIPNKAFYLVATKIGGFAWEAPAQIWYESLKAANVTTQFQQFADITHTQAGRLYGVGGTEQKAVLEAWKEVGLPVSGASTAAKTRGRTSKR
jgi:Zn-dependent metalloprotease